VAETGAKGMGPDSRTGPMPRLDPDLPHEIPDQRVVGQAEVSGFGGRIVCLTSRLTLWDGSVWGETPHRLGAASGRDGLEICHGQAWFYAGTCRSEGIGT